MSGDLNFGDCIGCGLCVLGCPAYEETGFDLLTARGRNKALQSGLAAAEMVEPIWACTLCGYCDAICPDAREQRGDRWRALDSAEAPSWQTS